MSAWDDLTFEEIETIRQQLVASRRGGQALHVLNMLREALHTRLDLESRLAGVERVHALTEHGHRWYALARPPYGPFASEHPDRNIDLFVLKHNAALSICSVGPGDILLIGRDLYPWERKPIDER